MAGYLGRLAAVIVGAVIALTSLPLPSVAGDNSGFGEPIVVAQIFDEPPLLLRMLGMKKREPERAPKIVKVPKATSNRPKVIKPKVVVNPKNDDAKVVLVIGDDNAVTLAKGLDIAFADTPTVRFESVAAAGSGLVATTPVDWQQTVDTRFGAAVRPDALVIMLGHADTAPITTGAGPVEFRSDIWETLYRERVRKLIVTARSRQVPVFWVGLVPVADGERSTDLAYLDEIYRQETRTSFGSFIDIWNEFADDAGGYVASGPDVGGQVRQLRLKDGIGFTKSGTRKLAFYAEQDIREWLTRGAPGAVMPDVAGGGLVMSLNDPEAGPTDELTGAAPATPPKEGTPLYQLVILGQPLAPVPGRVDDVSSASAPAAAPAPAPASVPN